MGSALTFQDIFKKSVLEAGGFLQSTSVETIVKAALYIALALLIGLLLFWLYRKVYAGVVYSHTFAVSIAGMTVLTCAIIVTIQSNVVLSLGMVGALSIVRYRTAVKDPMDLMFLFWAVAAGIAIGAGMFPIALVVSLFMLLLLFILKRKQGRDTMYILLVHYLDTASAEETGIDHQIRHILGTLRYQIKSKTLRNPDTEMAIEVRVPNENLAFVERIRAIDGVKDVLIVQYNGDYID